MRIPWLLCPAPRPRCCACRAVLCCGFRAVFVAVSFSLRLVYTLRRCEPLLVRCVICCYSPIRKHAFLNHAFWNHAFLNHADSVDRLDSVYSLHMIDQLSTAPYRSISLVQSAEICIRSALDLAFFWTCIILSNIFRLFFDWPSLHLKTMVKLWKICISSRLILVCRTHRT